MVVTTTQYPYLLALVNSYSDLRLETTRTSPNQLIPVLYRDTLGDGYGGFFYWNAASTAIDDNLVTVKPTAIKSTLPGRWIKQIFSSTGTGGTTPIGPAGGDLTGTYPDPVVGKLQGTVLTLSSLNDKDVITYDLSTNSFINSPGFVAAGDLSGDNSNQIVIGLQTIPISATVPTSNQVLEFNGSQWVPTTLASLPPSGPAGGDLSGTYPNPNVINIHGASVPPAGGLTTGNVLQVTTINSLSYGPVNVGGGINYITGVLPKANQQSQDVGLDLSGTTNAATVRALQNNLIKPVTLGSLQDGYVSSWVNADGYIEFKLITNNNISSSAAISVSKLGPGSDGYILQTVAGVSTWTAPGSVSPVPTSSPWSTVLANGNTSGGHDAIMTSGDTIRGAAGISSTGGALALVAGDGDTNQTGGALNLSSGKGSGTGGSGNISLAGGATGLTGTGGNININAGAGGATSGAGGNLVMRSGTATDGNGGDVTLTARSGIGTNRTGGALGITSGNSTGTGNGGAITITSGSGGAIGGAINVIAGTGGATSKGGTITITAGPGGATSGAGGDLALRSGTPTDGAGGNVVMTAKDAVGTNRTGGSVSITAGSATGSGSTGQITLNGGTAGGSGNVIGGDVVVIPGDGYGSGRSGALFLSKTTPLFILGSSNPATNGTMRVQNGFTMFGRNGANTTNLNVLSQTSGNDITTLGDTSTGNPNVALTIATGSGALKNGTISTLAWTASALTTVADRLAFTSVPFFVGGRQSITGDGLAGIFTGGDSGDGTTATVNGGTNLIKGGDPTGSGGTTHIGGDLTLRGGDASGATINNGGNVILRGGNGTFGGFVTINSGTPTAGDGYNVSITAANGVGTNKNGGSLIQNAGASTGSGTGGNYTLIAGRGGATGTAGIITLTSGAGGSSSGASGAINILTGTPVDGASGAISITTANGVGTNRSGGTITLTTGNATGPGNTAGSDIILLPGLGNGSGNPGIVSINLATPILRLGLINGSGAGAAASAGNIRTQDGFTIKIRNASDTGDNNILTSSNSISIFGNAVTTTGNFYSDTTSARLRLGSTDYLRAINSTVVVVQSLLAFAGGVNGQISAATNNAGNGPTLLVNAGDTSNAFSNGGVLTLRGGDGLSSNNTPGGVVIRGGNGAVSSTVTIMSGTPTAGDGYNIALTAASGVGTNRSGGSIILTAGANTGTGIPGSTILQNSNAVTIIEATYLGSKSIVSLNRGATLTTTEMPANTGDKVTFIGNAATNPSANSVSGGIQYASAGALFYRGSSGTITTIGSA